MKNADANCSRYAITIDTAKFGVTKDIDSKRNFIMFLVCQKSLLNDFLHAYGVVPLCEAYKLLKVEGDEMSSMVGWSMRNPYSDKYIDIGLEPKKLEDFLHGDGMELTLDFNVDGLLSEEDLAVYCCEVFKGGFNHER